MKLSQLTKRLKTELERLKDRYETGEREDINDRTYFSYVQRDTEHLFKLLSDWKKCANENLVHLEKEQIYKQQITATYDNIKALILHSYYRDVRKKQYMKIFKASQYVLDTMIQVMEDE